MKIGIISDTHGVYDEQWEKQLLQCDAIIHLGDFSTEKIYKKFENMGKQVYMVRGNTDKGEWANYLQQQLRIPLGHKMFFAVHNRADLPFDLTDADFILYGHTHVFEYYERFGKIFLNPGSAGDARGGLRSFVILHLEENKYDVERILLDVV